MTYTKDEMGRLLCLYAVTDRAWVGEQTLVQQVEEALKGGVTLVQLREKKMDSEDFLSEARSIKQLTQRYRVPLIINDDVEIALACGADGVHVGQSDMEAGDVRARLGVDKILGVTVKTPEQARLAKARGADYLGAGAVFATATKTDAQPLSLVQLRAICDSVDIPVVAIGGITAKNLAQLGGTGVAGVAVVSGIFGSPDIAAAARAMRERAERELFL